MDSQVEPGAPFLSGVLCGVEHGEPGSLLLVARLLWAGANGSLHTCRLVGALVLS